MPKIVTAAVLAAASITLAACSSQAATKPGRTSAPSPTPTGSSVMVSAPSAVARSTSPVTVPPMTVTHDPGKVTGTLRGPCRYQDSGQLPDMRCTPGGTDPAVSQATIRATICVTGYTSRVRPPAAQTDRFKFDVAYPAYKVKKTAKTELDHLVPLELGGSNDASNLWPETPPTPNPKDKVEDALHTAVCGGKVTLSAAQDAIAADWMTAEKTLGITK